MRHRLPRRRTALIVAAVAAVGLAAAFLTSSPASSDPDRDAVVIHAGVPVFLDHMETGTQLVPTGWGTGNENRMQGYDSSTDPGHATSYRWQLRRVAGFQGQIAYQIRNLSSDKCLTAPGDYGVNTQVVQRTCSGAWNQRWTARDPGMLTEDAVVLSPALSPELALSPAAGGELNKQNDFRLALKPTGVYLNQIWRTRAVHD